MKIWIYCVISFALTSWQACSKSDIQSCVENEQEIEQIKGINMAAPRDAFAGDPMVEITEVNADWISVIPFGFTRPDSSEVLYNLGGYQWWGETPEGIRKSIELAKANGLKVMMKPQIWIPGSWVGYLDFETEEEWERWEASYTDFVMLMVDISVEMEVDMICVGTEFSIGAVKREAYWRGLIEDIKAVYPGLLTYASNWDDYENVPFWSELDYIGVDAYFPLLDEEQPKVADLKKAWEPTVKKLNDFYCEVQKPILFTEWGYLSVDRCAFNTWELEEGLDQRPINEKCQSDAYKAMFETFREQPWWAGGFLWKWFPEMMGHEGEPEQDYTPQGKKAVETLRECFGRE